MVYGPWWMNGSSACGSKGKRSMSEKKILVVDDEKLIVKGIRFSLEQDGMEVDCAYDGEEALEYARNCEYDLVSWMSCFRSWTAFRYASRSGSSPTCRLSC